VSVTPARLTPKALRCRSAGKFASAGSRESTASTSKWTTTRAPSRATAFTARCAVATGSARRSASLAWTKPGRATSAASS
jgi:hypothetical protein